MALGVLLCTGCAGPSELSQLDARIRQTGVEQVATRHTESDGTSRLRVEAGLTDQRADPAPVAQNIAKVVWDTYPRRVDELEIILNGRVADRANRAELIERLGERNPQLEENTGGGGLDGWLLVLLAVPVVLLLGGLAGLLLRSRRGRNHETVEPKQPPRPYPSTVAWPPSEGPPPPSGRGRTH